MGRAAADTSTGLIATVPGRIDISEGLTHTSCCFLLDPSFTRAWWCAGTSITMVQDIGFAALTAGTSIPELGLIPGGDRFAEGAVRLFPPPSGVPE
jgi:hypothetical protein